MTGKLTASLRAAPATVPALAALALFVVWATDQAGYPETHWGPGGLIVLALLAIAVGLLGLRMAEAPAPVRVALACFTAFTAFSFLSILWAQVPGDAWEGANRTLLYLLVFALFACWRQQGASAALLLGAWTIALTVLAVYTALHLNAASEAGLQAMIPDGRLSYPSGYPNANAAQWLMACWPALLLARSERLPWGLRGLLGGGAVLLAEVALLSQSRGSLYATPVMLVLAFALLPRRTRTFALLVPVAAAIAAAAPTVLKVGNHLRDGHVTTTAVHNATVAMFATAVAAGLVVALGAMIEARSRFPRASAQRIRTGVRMFALAALVVAIVGGLAAAGNPITRIEDGWHTFKGGYASDNRSGSRLVSGLGSNRYDFYRVALDEFLDHPLVGIGADNYQQQYLAHGRSNETPHYPHSVELRTLMQTGLIGALLAMVGLLAALLAAARALRGPDPLAAAVAAAALGGFGYWVVHGSLDWFWEFAGLGGPAFATLGLACALSPGWKSASQPPRPDERSAAPGQPASLDPSASPVSGGAGRRGRLRPQLALVAMALLAGLVIAASLAAPWLSQLQVQSAAHIWTKAPRTAYARLLDAADLNPLSDQPYVVAGSIALRYGDLARADREFTRALARTPDDAYATLERGAIASARGRRTVALTLLERAVALNPRDALTRQVLQVARQGRRVNIDELNRLILLKAQQLA